MKSLLQFAFISLLILLTGCVSPQVPVPLEQSFYNSDKKAVGLVLEVPEAPSLALEGNIGLLDYAIISAATAPISKHLETLDTKEFIAISGDLSQSLEGEGFSLIQLDTLDKDLKLAKFKDPDTKDTVYFARSDYRDFSKEHKVDYLLKLSAKRVGLARPYYGFIPTDSPRVVFEITGEMIDLSSNQLLWYSDVAQTAYAAGEWDEGPSYPGLTNTYYIVMNNAKQQILAALAKHEAENNILPSVEGTVPSVSE
ncbi:hypothetical protein ACJJIF_14695 [Microbulbifer sp. SSSA002]|uniref:hypothetical protein n=1 Tax=Microbulbifer sp. SSSA002 TaxID=3243376 RepID=UPI0040391AF0